MAKRLTYLFPIQEQCMMFYTEITIPYSFLFFLSTFVPLLACTQYFFFLKTLFAKLEATPLQFSVSYVYPNRARRAAVRDREFRFRPVRPVRGCRQEVPTNQQSPISGPNKIDLNS